MSGTTGRTAGRHIRVPPEQRARLEAAAAGTLSAADRLAVELAMEAPDRREWPATEAEIHLLRSAMFTARAAMRDMEKAERQDEIEEIGRAISPRSRPNGRKRRTGRTAERARARRDRATATKKPSNSRA